MEPVELQPDTTGFAIGFNRAALQVDTESLADRLGLQNVLGLLKNKMLHVVYFQAEAALPAALETASKAQEEASKAQEEAVKAMQKAETAEKNAARALQSFCSVRTVRWVKERSLPKQRPYQLFLSHWHQTLLVLHLHVVSWRL